MNDAALSDIPHAVPASANLDPTPAKKPRGRPKVAASETPQQRIDRLRAELQKAEDAARLIESKQAGIVGKAVLTHALANPDFRHQLATLLRSEVKNKNDIAAIAELLR